MKISSSVRAAVAEQVDPSPTDTSDAGELEEELYARHAEIKELNDLVGEQKQRGTPVPALFSTVYKFIQNPSTVSVETFKRMLDTDDTLGSGVDFLTSCLAARLGHYEHPSQDITKFVNKALDNLEGGWTCAVKEMLSACWAGFSVSEIVWANKPEGFVPESLPTLPPSTILFESERTGRLTEDGILQYQRNYHPGLASPGGGLFYGLGNFGWGSSAYRPDLMAKFGDLPFPLRAPNSFNYLSIRIPKMKCIHYAWDAQGRFGNPYGRSTFRRAYKWWIVKDAVLKMMSIALDRKGTPLLVVFANGQLTLVDPTKVTEGESLRGKRNIGKSAQQAALDAFKNIHNDSTIVLPGKKGEAFDVEVVKLEGNPDVFINAINLCNHGLMRSLLIPPLVFTNGDGTGSYALGESHAKTFDKVCDSSLEGFKATIVDQFIRQIVAYNFPREVWEEHGFGTFGKRELTQDEREKEATLFATAIDKGIVDTNDLKDLNVMRERMGFEPRTTPIKKPLPMFPGFGGDDDPPLDDSTEQDAEGNFGGDQNGGGDDAGGKPGGAGAGNPFGAGANRPRAKAKDAGGAAAKPARAARARTRPGAVALSNFVTALLGVIDAGDAAGLQARARGRKRRVKRKGGN